MADLPILFSAPMVRAILREIDQPGTGKTQTRRVLTDQPVDGARFQGFDCDGQALFTKGCAYGKQRLRYSAGDRLYVREAWAPLSALTHNDPGVQALASGGFYRADAGTVEGEISRWRPGIHMPRWASRITLIVTDVRVQRLQEISEADAMAEGICRHGNWFGLSDDDWDNATRNAGSAFAGLWDRLNATRGYGWDANPWVAAYTFRLILGNIDQVQP